jgi:peptide/nickel transport system permease protein
MSGSAQSVSHWRGVRRRLVRQPMAVAALVYLFAVVLVAIAAPWVVQHDPNYQYLEARFSGPSSEFWLGTDNLGRDTFSRLVYGARTSMFVTVAVVVVATIVSVPIGLLSGYFSGKVDMTVMRIVDAFLSIPPLVLALAVAGILGPGVRNLIIALVLVIIPGQVRLVRGQTLAVREEGYVAASQAIGTSSAAIIRRRVFPHVISPMLVQISIALGTILVVEASLSYLGLGKPPPDASWGSMLENGFAFLSTDSRLVFVPAVAIALTTLAFNALGEGMRDAGKGTVTIQRRASDRLGTTSVVAENAAVVAPADDVVLSIRDLSVEFDTARGRARVLDGVSIDLRRGEILGLVGESGCGKTVTSMSVLRLLPSPPARIVSGQILYGGRDLLRLSGRDLREVRGKDIAMIFQDPMASLNPAYTVGDQITESIRLHQSVSRKQARKRAIELLDLVGIPDPGQRLDDFPHTFSGGMRQRVLIGMALANEPRILIADEPTTALDVTVQAQIIELIRDLRDEFAMSVIFVTHDLGVVQDLCDRVTVMYAGQVVEQTTAADLFNDHRHPYSDALLAARPRTADAGSRLQAIPGVVPSALNMPTGCRFEPRCTCSFEACSQPIPLVSVDLRAVRCCRPERVAIAPAQALDSTEFEGVPT